MDACSLIRRSDARGLREIQAANDSDFFCYLQMNARKFGIFRCRDQAAMEFFVPHRDLQRVVAAFWRAHLPYRFERQEDQI